MVVLKDRASRGGARGSPGKRHVIAHSYTLCLCALPLGPPERHGQVSDQETNLRQPQKDTKHKNGAMGAAEDAQSVFLRSRRPTRLGSRATAPTHPDKHARKLVSGEGGQPRGRICPKVVRADTSRRRLAQNSETQISNIGSVSTLGSKSTLVTYIRHMFDLFANCRACYFRSCEHMPKKSSEMPMSVREYLTSRCLTHVLAISAQTATERRRPRPMFAPRFRSSARRIRKLCSASAPLVFVCSRFPGLCQLHDIAIYSPCDFRNPTTHRFQRCSVNKRIRRTTLR